MKNSSVSVYGNLAAPFFAKAYHLPVSIDRMELLHFVCVKIYTFCNAHNQFRCAFVSSKGKNDVRIYGILPHLYSHGLLFAHRLSGRNMRW